MNSVVKKIVLGLGLLVVGVLVFLAGVLWPLGIVDPIMTLHPIAITNVTVIDTEAGTRRTGMTVLVADRRITAVGSADSVPIPGEARRIDGSGKYLIPGLWDMHVHIPLKLSPQLHLPLYVAHGVTNVRDMADFCFTMPDPLSACTEDKRAWDRRIRAGELLGPRIWATGSFPVNGPDERQEGHPAFFGPGTEEEAGELVRYLEEQDVDFIKVYSGMLREPFFALMDEARELGMEALGHKPLSVSAIEASNAGMKSFEHARLFLFECYPGAEEYRRTMRTRNPTTDVRRAMIDTHDPAMCGEIFGTFVRNGTWYFPTHLTRRMDAFADDEAFRNDTRLKYVSKHERRKWNEDADGMIASDPSPEGREAYMDFYLAGLELTGRAHAAGVKVLAGTDAPDSFVFPGSGLHDELEELVKAGLTPSEVLWAATVGPAEYFSVTADYGSVAAGKVADLVLLDADPLEDITNTRKINAVVFNGNVYNREDLDHLLVYVESRANSLFVSWRLLWSDLRRTAF